MAKLNKAGDPQSMGEIDIPQGDFRTQVDVVADELRQLAGNADVSGVMPTSDPLNAPYTLYVNPYTGQDTFVGGQFNDLDAELERRISLQRLECGYTSARPFKTVNRAAIEAAIITSRDYLNSDISRTRALVTIKLESGEHLVDNSAGANLGSGFPEIPSGTEPTIAELVRFNDPIKGGVILPRGCSVISLDLRKTVIRPAFVTPFEDEAPDYSNRRSIFKVTGGGYYYGLTFKDNLQARESHHLLHCFEFASQAELDLLYQKVFSSFGSAEISAGNTVTQSTEFEIVGPKPLVPTDPTDTVSSASPYIYNCSVRSVFGLGGIFANGDETAGFRSMVVAQFTGVSLQRDMRVWQEYLPNQEWLPINRTGAAPDNSADYTTYINLDPNNLRMDPNKRSFHVRAVNDSIIQEVSVFAIGQGVHHWVESGGELTVTNSNSNFGGVAALAENFRRISQPFDSGYSAVQLRRPRDPFDFGIAGVKEITLGFVNSFEEGDGGSVPNRLFLTEDLVPGRRRPTQPLILEKDNYSLKTGDFIWIDNPNGPDYRSRIRENGFNAQIDANLINVQFPFQTQEISQVDEDGNEVFVNKFPDDNAEAGSFSQFPRLPGLRVYIRRYQDIRSVEERSYSLLLNSTRTDNRLPVRDYVLQPSGGGQWLTRTSSVQGSEVDPESGNFRIKLGYVKQASVDNEYNEDKYYRKGDVITKDNKHFICVLDTITRFAGPFDPDQWAENYVHMEEDYAPGGNRKNSNPILIFDFDKQDTEVTPVDFLLTGDVTTDPLIFPEPQYRSATDYLGIFEQLRNWGLASNTAQDLLKPQTNDQRDLNLNTIGAPNTNFELRRPSNVRLFGHAWEWAGFSNYTKSLPDYQRTLSPDNKFTYFFTDQSGGRVFCAGFNEEGLQVSPRGLEDVTTGDVLSADNLSSPDRELEQATTFEKLSVGELNVTKYAESSARASTTDPGIVRLYQEGRVNDSQSVSDVVTFNDVEESFAKKLPGNLPYVIFHVIPNVRFNPDTFEEEVIPGTPTTDLLVGRDSIPFGFDASERALRWEKGDPFSNSVTEALIEAAKVFVPTGSTIVISVHGTRVDGNGSVEIEDGPIQLANGFAPVVIAGARGAGINDPDGKAPKVRLNRRVTKSALGRTPQYSKQYAFSAGVTFSDLRVECACENKNGLVATINGGFGVGKFDTVLTWINPVDVAACATTYGQQAIFQFYGEANTTRTFLQEFVDWRPNGIPTTGDDRRSLEFFGAAGGSGLISQGCDIIVDFRDGATGGGGTNTSNCVFAFDARLSAPGAAPLQQDEIAVKFVAAGSRGGVTTGGRSRPICDLNFNNKPFFIDDFVSQETRSAQNYFGESFRFRSGTLSDTYNLEESESTRFFARRAANGPLQLNNGCCVDIRAEVGQANSPGRPKASGPIAFYWEIEEGEVGVDRGDVLVANNSTNAFVYNANRNRNVQNP